MPSPRHAVAASPLAIGFNQYMLGKLNPLDVTSPNTVVFVPLSLSKLFVVFKPSPTEMAPFESTSKVMAPVELQLLVGANLILLSVGAPVGNVQSVAVDERFKVWL